MTTTADRPESFGPVWAPDARVLVLGSMPGRASLRAARYYAHPRNLFWEIVGQVLGADPDAAYDARLETLKRHRIAVWDVAHRCHRPGSLDAAIREVEPNDVPGLVGEMPDLRAILCNGQKAHELLLRHVLRRSPHALSDLPVARLPSTSPANASVPRGDKLEAWQTALRRAGVGRD